MRSIAVMNQKGGVGKTTTSVNLSAALCEHGYRVCLVDLDPQAHASLHLGITTGTGIPSVYDVLMARVGMADIRQQVRPGLSVVPASIDLAAVEVELAGESGREGILRDRLTRSDISDDFVIIDCPPSLGILTLNALAAVNEVLLPMQPHYLALHGLSKLLGTIDVVARRFNPALRLSGVVFCMYESGTRLAAEVSSDVTEFFRRVHDPASPWSDAVAFQTRIRRNVRLAEAPSFGQSVLEYAPTSPGAEDYRQLATEWLARCGMTRAA